MAIAKALWMGMDKSLFDSKSGLYNDRGKNGEKLVLQESYEKV